MSKMVRFLSGTFKAVKIKNLHSSQILVPNIGFGQTYIGKIGEQIQSNNFQYCIAILLKNIEEDEFGFMHYRGCEDKDLNEEHLKNMIKKMAIKDKNDVTVGLYYRPSGDVFDSTYNLNTIVGRTNYNLYNLVTFFKENNFNKINIDIITKDIIIDSDCNIKSLSLLDKISLMR